ncbi:MAG: SIS domain-containing protein [Propioniciclava sp.]
MTSLASTHLWRETAASPGVLTRLARRLTSTSPLAPTAITLLSTARRIVITGNGAALYAGRVLESALRGTPAAPAAIAVEAGVIAAGALAWRDGDVVLVVSSSGELGDAVTLLPDRLPRPRVVLTAAEDSTLGSAADATLRIEIESQEAVTHTQAYLSNVLTLLSLARVLGADVGDLDSLPERLQAQLPAALAAATDLAAAVAGRTTGIAVASGAGWSTAAQTALLCKEVAGLSIEGFEAREAATTGMYALTADTVVIVHPLAHDPQVREAERVCALMGAGIVEMPLVAPCAPLELPLLAFPSAIALAGEIGLQRGRDIDQPDWTDAYYGTARINPTR